MKYQLFYAHGKITPEEIRDEIGAVRIDKNVFSKVSDGELVASPLYETQTLCSKNKMSTNLLKR